ncbi:MAG: co-chaperone GroES [Candidatus Gracilibacteria bacterium]|nr:co-chaperone GroES [Candidatus Gracilibacteria bacterium]MDQ7022451.1 co-chaperone GroES [Candidatus Gracilibacteria bacterium]
MQKIKPLGDRVLLKKYVENKEKTNSGIYIPKSEKQEVSYIYEVIETAEKVENINTGDKVLCGQYSGDEIKIDGEQYKIVGVDYLLAIID